MALWNATEEVRKSHNCFTYAIDTIDLDLVNDCKKDKDCNVGFPQPGYDSGYTKFSDKKEKGCIDMVSRLWGDNGSITASTFEKPCPYGTSKIALIVDPKRDYHFLRQDPDGYWSHKPGAMQVTRLDASGRPIVRPDRALFVYKGEYPLNYSKFCGYFCVPRGKALRMSTKVRKGGRLPLHGSIHSHSTRRRSRDVNPPSKE